MKKTSLLNLIILLLITLTSQVSAQTYDACSNLSGTQSTVPACYTQVINNNIKNCNPVDLCPNISGNQCTVPSGYKREYVTQGAYYRCVVDNVTNNPDKCLNISGTQSTVPEGYTRDQSGNCSFTQYTCPTVDTGKGYNVTVIVSPNSNGGNPNTFSPSVCSAFTATAISNISGTNLPCGNTHFSGGLQWNAIYTPRPAPVNGSCGSANNSSSLNPPTTNLCSVGVSSTVSTSGSKYNWTCSGANGGSTASCSANRLVVTNGTCGSTNNSCTTGTFSDRTDTQTQYLWNCNGTNGGTNASCSLNIPINGACNSTSQSCVSGSYVDTADTPTQYLWNCNGSNGGGNVSCSLNKPVNGSCGSTNNSCISGNVLDVTDTPTQYLWNCNGTNGGNNTLCSLNKPVNGTCGSTNNSCTTGTFSDRTDTQTQYLWNCNGTNGGTNASCSLNLSLNCSTTPNTKNKCVSIDICTTNSLCEPVNITNASTSDIDMFLNPYIINENEQCTVTWDITYQATPLYCAVYQVGGIGLVNDANSSMSGFQVINGEYEIKCFSDASMQNEVIKSETKTCLKNPNIKEI